MNKSIKNKKKILTRKRNVNKYKITNKKADMSKQVKNKVNNINKIVKTHMVDKAFMRM